MGYLPIEDHGVIGDLHSIALVGIDGAIDWCCLPHFDSPSVFASILDDEIGGEFKITAVDAIKNKQTYLPDSNILVGRAYTKNGLAEIENFMPICSAERPAIHQIIRRVSCVRGEVEFELKCRPALDFARRKHKVVAHKEGVIFEEKGVFGFGLKSAIPLRIEGPSVCAKFSLKEGERCSFVFFCYPKTLSGDPFLHLDDVDSQFERTEVFWQRWISRITYTGRWSEMVSRSALVLKLLTFEPTGAIVAAPTLGLPEGIGGTRNWDYRYTWIRDASFTVYAFMRIGFTEEAERFMDWITSRLEQMNDNQESPIRLMYRISGGEDLEETHLDHLKGYRNSKPIRVGNAAFDQLQLDIFGELIDSVYLFNKYGKPVSYRQWSQVRKLMAWLCENWDKPDEGIWETRGGRKNFVFSRLMCWVALDRASRMCVKHSLPGNHSKWEFERDKIYDQIMTKGWNQERQSFRQHYETDALDAANLLMPLVKFISPSDPRMLSTIDATLKTLSADSLVFRYDPKFAPDGIVGQEGTFSICTFWLVECLTRAGRLHEARQIFQKMLGHANHLGLYSEEIGIHGEMLGNFPQAFTHLSLISSAFNLDRALSQRR